jgi:HEAT repeat protein
MIGFRGAGAVAAAAVLCWATAAPAQPRYPPDPVEDLRQALYIRLEEVRNKVALDHRREVLQKKVDALRTLSDFRRALQLTEWKDDHREPLLREIDQTMRTEVGNRFRKGVERVIQLGSPAAKIAVADMLAEMGASTRSLDPADQGGFTRTFEPELARLLKDNDARVEAAAARALGKINADPKAAVRDLKGPLQSNDVSLRRAAAQGLLDLVQTVAQLNRKGRTQQGIQAGEAEVIAAGTHVVPAAGLGLADPDAQVRRRCIEAIQQAAASLGELVPEPRSSKELPAEGRQLTPAEREDVNKYADAVQKAWRDYLPLLEAFKGQATGLARAVNDPDADIRLLTRRALEDMANARLRIRRLFYSIPAPPGEKAEARRLEVLLVAMEAPPKDDPLLDAVKPSLDELARRLADPDVRVRLASLDFLEFLEEAAAPAVRVLAAALADPDRFVRWAASRTLGKVGPVKTELTVPGLARLMADPDLDVRAAAALTLERYGPVARAAIPALIKASATGDDQGRVAAMKALGNVTRDTAEAVPALASNLSHEDNLVRVTAAQTLGKFGAVAKAAVPALEKALNDEDMNVRQAASDALLSILQP